MDKKISKQKTSPTESRMYILMLIFPQFTTQILIHILVVSINCPIHFPIFFITYFRDNNIVYAILLHFICSLLNLLLPPRESPFWKKNMKQNDFLKIWKQISSTRYAYYFSFLLHFSSQVEHNRVESEENFYLCTDHVLLTQSIIFIAVILSMQNENSWWYD